MRLALEIFRSCGSGASWPKVAPFAEMAGGRNGFLREAKGLRQGQLILAQVVSLPEPGKAVTLSTRVLYKGAHVIHTPQAAGVNVSRRIRDPEERARLTDAVSGVALPDGGVILRSGAEGADALALQAGTEGASGRAGCARGGTGARRVARRRRGDMQGRWRCANGSIRCPIR